MVATGCTSKLPVVGPPVDVECLTSSDEVDAFCVHTGDPPLELRPSSWELADGAGVSMEFTPSNDGDEPAAFVEFPSLIRRGDGEWNNVWLLVLPTLENRLDPGLSFSWEVSFDKTETGYGADDRVNRYELDPGTYAAVVGAVLGDRTVGCVAPFDVGDGESE